MKLVDVNLLPYAVDETSPQHDRARGWLEEVLSATETVAFAWSVLLAFVRLSTRAQVFDHPLTADDALDIIDGWLAQPTVVVVHPTDQHLAVIKDLLRTVGTAGNLTTTRTWLRCRLSMEPRCARQTRTSRDLPVWSGRTRCEMQGNGPYANTAGRSHSWTMAADQVDPPTPTSTHASAYYRRHLVRVLTTRTLARVAQAA